MMPGETALTRMPREAYSTASDLAAAASPPLVSAASTEGACEFATSARVAEMLTSVSMRPNRSSAPSTIRSAVAG